MSLAPQRCLRRRGLFGKRDVSEEGTHLEGKVSMQPEEEGAEAKPLCTLDNGQWVGFRVRAFYILDMEDEEAPRPLAVVTDLERLHQIQLHPPYGDLSEPRVENTTPFLMKVRYAAPPEEGAEPAVNDEGEPLPPPPFASIEEIEWVDFYAKVMKALHLATEDLIDAGTVIPIDREVGKHWALDNRDAYPHDYLFNHKLPRTLPSGEFLDAVPQEDLNQFVFPQHELCSHSGARLLIFARYGPLDERGVLRGGKNRE